MAAVGSCQLVQALPLQHAPNSSSRLPSRRSLGTGVQLSHQRCVTTMSSSSASQNASLHNPLAFNTAAMADVITPHAALGYSQQPMRAQDMDPSSLLFSQRIIFLGTQVDDMSADVIISQLLLLDAQDPTQDIKMIINSPGGSVTAGMGIYDAMKLCRADVSTICFGLAASMGAFLLAAGTRGKRYAMPNSRIMIHQPLGGAQGSAIDVGLQVREMMYHKVKLNKILSRLTGKSEEQVELDTDRDNFMNAWEATEYGLVDAVLGADNPQLVAPIGEVKEPPKTKVWDLWTIKEGRERRVLPGENNIVRTP